MSDIYEGNLLSDMSQDQKSKIDDPKFESVEDFEKWDIEQEVEVKKKTKNMDFDAENEEELGFVFIYFYVHFFFSRWFF